MDYKKSGVDVQKADAFVDRIKKLVPQTFNENVMQGIGGFAAVYKLSEDQYIAASTDGVGTKLKLAQSTNQHYNIGIDLVAMCVNDLLCVGAKPLFFLDYMAFGKLNTQVSEELIAGMVDGCKQSGMALIGGETAEMPGMYEHDEYDLAGFSVGSLTENDMYHEKNIQAGDVLIGFASSGFHSNGYSLLRKLVQNDEKEIVNQLLVPTTIYVNHINQLKKSFPDAIKAMAHITGGGIENIPRMSEKFDYDIHGWPTLEQLPPIFKTISDRSKLSRAEMLETFNMGIGLVILVNKDAATDIMKSSSIKCWKLGEVKPGAGHLHF